MRILAMQTAAGPWSVAKKLRFLAKQTKVGSPSWFSRTKKESSFTFFTHKKIKGLVQAGAEFTACDCPRLDWRFGTFEARYYKTICVFVNKRPECQFEPVARWWAAAWKSSKNSHAQFHSHNNEKITKSSAHCFAAKKIFKRHPQSALA
jgi:hypothetical protein